jgi:GT2 family glycosyltransferase
MKNTNYSIGVLLTCFNRREKTISCLKALYQCYLPDNHFIEVFLVDDGSSDNTSEEVKSLFPGVNVIQGNGKLFWNRGMHLAWSRAVQRMNYDFYVWLNDDTILFENALELMLDYSHSVNNERIVVGATCSSITGNLTYGGYEFPKKKLAVNGRWQNCDYFNGNIVLIPAWVYENAGLNDKRFKHALGDFDYGMRARKLGFIHSLSPVYLGYCELHESDPTWRNHNTPVWKRFLHLYKPLGNNPFEFFLFDFRHNGLLLALTHFFSIHLRMLFPTLWKKP